MPRPDRARFADGDRADARRSRAPGPRGRGAHAWAGWVSPVRSTPLVARLADPSKIVWRAAAWALRRLGQPGDRPRGDRRGARRAATPPSGGGPLGSSPTSSTGWTTGPSSPSHSSSLTRDPDLLTRLQALRTLRQWFYRTADPAMSRTDRRDLPGADGGARRRRSFARA